MDHIKEQKRQDILNWLSPLNFWPKQNDIFERRCKGTGEWLLGRPEFQKWIEGENPILWCPGDRKSILYNANLSQLALGKRFLRNNLKRSS
jgi:hypothetical protein